MTRRAARYESRLDRSTRTYSSSVECAPNPGSPKRSTAGSFVRSAANAASVPPPSARSSTTSLRPLGVDRLRMIAQLATGFGRLERRPAALEDRRPSRREATACARARARLPRSGRSPPPAARVRPLARSPGRDDVPVGSGLGDGPVQLQAHLGLGQIPHLQDLVREFVQRIDASLRRRPGMRRPALHLQVDGRDAAGGKRELVVLRARSFERHDRIVLGSGLRDQLSRAGRADLLVRVHQHGQLAVLGEVQRLQHRNDMHEHGDALLVVGNAQAVGAIAVHTEGLLLQHAALIHGVHVADHEDRALPVPENVERTIRPTFGGVSAIR